MHDFHMVLKSEMKNKLFNLSILLNKSLSETAVYIIKKVEPVFEFYHLAKEENAENGMYRQFLADEDMHVYMEEVLYKKIKQIYAHMFMHSMAIIVRAMIFFFLKGVKKYGLYEFIKIMDEYKERQEEIFNQKMKWDKPVKKELSHLKVIPRLYRLTFSDDLTLIRIELLKKYKKKPLFNP